MFSVMSTDFRNRVVRHRGGAPEVCKLTGPAGQGHSLEPVGKAAGTFELHFYAASPSVLLVWARRRVSSSFLAVCFVALLLMVCSNLGQAQSSFPGPSSPLYGARPESARVESGLPKALKEVGIDQKLNQQLPLDLVFKDESGQPVKLQQFFGKRPVVLSLVYYNCPMLCTQVLNGMVAAFNVLSFNPGADYEVVTVSFDARETPELATAKKAVYVNYLHQPKRAGAVAGWHFLTGDEAAIKQLTDAAGFRYRFDQKTNQFAHASGIMVATPQGKLAQYYYGIEYSAKDLRLGLVEASENKIGTVVDQLLLYCYHYDPATGKYGAVVMNMMRIGGVATVIGIIGMLLLLRRRRPHELTQLGSGA